MKVQKIFQLFELNAEQKKELYFEVRNSYQIEPGYLLLTIAACLIALLGLLINSTAVVIGAMLISPLMNPFLSAALALTIGDWTLGRLAVRTILFSMLLVILTCVLATAISPLKEATPEIIARTKPNLMDLLIAFFAGMAGTYTLMVRKGLSAIPGVAIATAVMPPLCVTGFGLYHWSWTIAAGAFILFLTNLVAIIVSSSMMFAIAKFRTSDEYAEVSRFAARRRLAFSLVILVIISIPLLYSLIQAAHETGERRAIEIALRRELPKTPQATLELGRELKNDNEGHLLLNVVLRTPVLLTPRQLPKPQKRS